jgi:N,N'-diacetyllegionaminate synthase
MDRMVREVRIGQRYIGPGHPCLIIAEAGVNHNGRLELADQLIRVAADAKADAIKFQTFRAESVASADAPKAEYQKRATDSSETQLEMLRRLELPATAYRSLKESAERAGLLFLSTPFDEESVELLNDLRIDAFKIPSGELTNHAFLRHVARKARPMIVSTGMATIGEVEAAVRVILETGNPDIILLHCVSNYPADPNSINLRAMATMAQAFGLPVGFSDHTLGIEIPLAAVALGACVLEKHFTLDRNLPGPDHQASLDPGTLAALVLAVRNVEAALGHGRKEPSLTESNIAAVARRSLVAWRDIPAGALLTNDFLTTRRPGTGLPPFIAPYLIGLRARHTIPAGTVISLEMFSSMQDE